jgi:hypothetical protein
VDIIYGEYIPGLANDASPHARFNHYVASLEI